MKQKDVFLTGEGNRWYERNADKVSKHKLPYDDAVLVDVLKFRDLLPDKPNVLEIGCGEGRRLEWLIKNESCSCFGIDPADEAVEVAKKRGVNAEVGTADQLTFENGMFDVSIFGFCLYLCDREDLFRIAAEADRVLKNSAWLILRDFYCPQPVSCEYCHKKGVFSYKMDYRKLFTWHPAYTVFSHSLTHHGGSAYTDDKQEWVATTVIRKCFQA